VIVSTAHKAKGREWDSVRLASDFASACLGKHPDAPSEVRLFYVAMTRAKQPRFARPTR
jgi:superfamily I DNA/RNA helicase